MQFEITRDKIQRSWVVYRVGGDHSQHAHLQRRKTCYLLIKLINKGIMPRSTWLQESCRRLLLEEEFARLKKPKDKYHNKGNYKRG